MKVSLKLDLPLAVGLIPPLVHYHYKCYPWISSSSCRELKLFKLPYKLNVWNGGPSESGLGFGGIVLSI